MAATPTGRSASSSLCLVCATCLLCALRINCFPKPLGGSAKLWSSLMVRMLAGEGIQSRSAAREGMSPWLRGNSGHGKGGGATGWWCHPCQLLSLQATLPALVISAFSPFPVPPSKPTVNIPSSATIGNRAVLTCSEKDGSPPSEYTWYRDGVLMPTEPKSNRAFSNSSYSLNQKTGELVWIGWE